MATVKLYFEWSSFRPDQRAYRQQSIDLFPALGSGEGAVLPKIEMEVPLEGKYVANTEEICTKQLSGEPAPAPILTLQGLKYVVDQFDHIFYDTEAPEDTTSKGEWTDEDEQQFLTGKPKEEKKDDDWDADWGNAPAPTPVAVGTNDEWAEATTNNKDEKWDETDEKWE